MLRSEYKNGIEAINFFNDYYLEKVIPAAQAYIGSDDVIIFAKPFKKADVKFRDDDLILFKTTDLNVIYKNTDGDYVELNVGEFEGYIPLENIHEMSGSIIDLICNKFAWG